MTPQNPLLLEVLAHVPTDFFHCLNCERVFGATGIGAEVRRQMRADYPSEMLEEAGRLAVWVQSVAERYGERLHIRLIDPQSPEGFYKSLRYWVCRYPTFIINRRQKHMGWDPESVERLLEQYSEETDSLDRSADAG